MKLQKPLLSGLSAIIAGIVFSAAGSDACKSWAKFTIENYVGFGILSAGIVFIVLGIFLLAEGIFKTILAREKRIPRWLPSRFSELSSLKSLFQKLHLFACGVALFIVGSLTGSTWAKFTIENYFGFGMLMVGSAALILGVVGIATAYVLGAKHSTPLFNGVLAVACGIVMFLIGSVTGNEWAKYTVANYVGFGTLLVGIFTISLGAFGVINATIKRYIEQVKAEKPIRVKEKVLFGSLWIIGFAIGSSFVGSIVANAWAAASIENHFGYGFLMIGMATLLIGLIGIPTAFATQYLTTFRARRILIEQLETKDLDAISDPVTKDFISATDRKLLILLRYTDEIALADLAYSLGFSLNITKKFLRRSLTRSNLYGYITLDEEKYISRNGLRKNIEALLVKH